MTPKEKAIELYNQMYDYCIFEEEAKRCSLIAVENMLDILKIYKKKDGYSNDVINFSISRITYLLQVKLELEKL